MENKEYLNDVHYNDGSKNDVAISFEDFLEVTETLLDQYLSRTVKKHFYCLSDDDEFQECFKSKSYRNDNCSSCYGPSLLPHYKIYVYVCK